VIFSYTVRHTAKCRLHMAPTSLCVGHMLYQNGEEVAAFVVSVQCYSMTLFHVAESFSSNETDFCSSYLVFLCQYHPVHDPHASSMSYGKHKDTTDNRNCCLQSSAVSIIPPMIHTLATCRRQTEGYY